MNKNASYLLVVVVDHVHLPVKPAPLEEMFGALLTLRAPVVVEACEHVVPLQITPPHYRARQVVILRGQQGYAEVVETYCSQEWNLPEKIIYITSKAKFSIS